MMRSRREFLQFFLRTAGCFAALASSPFLPRQRAAAAKAATAALFPHGVASGDPQPDAVMLWTRAVPRRGASTNVPLTVQVSTQTDFGTVVLEERVAALADSDYTVRVLAQNLAPDTVYYYRFLDAGGRPGPLGRTWTAPAAGADRDVRFAWVSCQNYEQGFYGGWRRLLVDDEAAGPSDRIDFILHLGDFIYEDASLVVRDVDFRNLYGEARYMKDARGTARTAEPFPSGGRKGEFSGHAAATLDDYRHLYKTYLSDPHLQAARARWPFVCTWDDHEFANNCWQGHTPHGHAQTGRYAANRAWFEFIPAILEDSGAVPGVEVHAHGFRETAPQSAPFGDPGEPTPEAEPNNQAAIGSLTIYRSLRFGSHVDLVVTDTRSYRSDHAVPEWWVERHFPEGGLRKTPELLRVLDRGRSDNGNNPARNVRSGQQTLPNPRADSAPGTMLGTRQKQWWKDSVAGSDATWKVWANSVAALSLTLDFDAIPFSDAPRIVLNDDMWDGYPSEREELARFVRERPDTNLISLAGDLHAHLAGTVTGAFPGEEAEPAFPEFVAAGISSASLFRIARLRVPEGSPFEVALRDNDDPSVPLLDNSLRHGVFSSMVYRWTGSLRLSRTARNDDANPWLAHADTAACGYGLVKAGKDVCAVSLVTTAAPLQDLGDAPAPVLRRVHFVVRRGERSPQLVRVEGTTPFDLTGEV